MRAEAIATAKRPPLSWFPFGVLLALTPALLLIPITHDAIWQMWLGRQILGGARLYVDIVEVNPPLWFWMAAPLAAIGADARVTIIGFFVVAVALALFLTPPRFRLPSLGVLLLVPLHDFGQREHFALIATLPYVFAIAARARGEIPRHPVIIGLFAGIGLCLKPHFLLVPLALEMLVARKKRARPETMALMAFVCAYAAAIPIFAPDYISRTVPMIMRFYGAFGQQQNYVLVALTFLFAAVGAVAGRRTGSAESRASLIAALAFVPTVVIQGKGFPYHSIPVRGFLCLASMLELMRVRRSPFADAPLVAAIMLSCLPFGTYENGFRVEMERHLAGVRRGTSIIVLASNPSVSWPMVEEHRLNWQLHEFSAWQVNAVVRNPALLSEVQRIVGPDLAKRPQILVLDRRPVLGVIAHQLVPASYLKCYRLRLRTERMESFWKAC